MQRSAASHMKYMCGRAPDDAGDGRGSENSTAPDTTPASRERPILFSAPMVRAIRTGRKTQTRRVVKPQPSAGVRHSPFVPSGLEDGHGREIRLKYGQPGDRLWVRETWQMPWVGATQMFPRSPESAALYMDAPSVVYAADWNGPPPRRWRPSIHMPRWASRLTLEVVSVRVERLHEITEEDARAEGVDAAPFCTAGRPNGMEHVEAFEDLWNAINGPGAWEANPWVWVVEFRRVTS